MSYQTRSDQTRPASESPTLASRPLLDLVARFQNKLEDKWENASRYGDKIISASVAPSDAERAALNARRRDLVSALSAGGDADRVAKAIATLLGAFPTFAASSQSAFDQTRGTIAAVDGLPSWAICAAVNRFVRGEAVKPWDSSRAPTPPQIRAEALDVMRPLEGELYRLAQVLDAEIVDIDTTPEERAAALAHWQVVRAEIVKNGGFQGGLRERTAAEETTARAEQAAANKRVAPSVGSQMAANERFSTRKPGGGIAVTDELRAKLRAMLAEAKGA